jgi:hypothetical protein
VLALAIIVFLAGVSRGSGMLHNVLAAVTLAAMAWSARTRLARPLLQLSAARGAQRLMAAGVFVRELEGVERLAAVPADGAAAPAAAPVTLTSAGTDDTDRARQAADVVFNAPAADIAHLAPMATQTAREAAAGADRALAFGRPSAIALLLATAVFALTLLPSWPASVPLGLHVLLFGLCIALARAPAAAGTTAAPTALATRAIDVAWAVVLLAASLVATRLARQFSVDTATLAFAAFALGSIAFAWLATAVYRRHAWALRRPAWGQAGDLVWLAFATAAGLAATVAAVHLPRWQGAFETAALTRATWSIATALVAVAIAALLVFMLAVQWVQTRRFAKTEPATPSVAATEPPAAPAVTAATNALASPTEAPAPPANP